jgi:signal recognition particle subunit SRP68
MSEALKVPILQTIKKDQNEYGLRYDDYSRYRRHCVRKLQKLRKTLNFHHGSGKKIEPKKFNQQSASVWKTEEGQELLTPSENAGKFIEMVLTESERAWAFAMEAKKAMDSDPSKIQLVKRKMKRAKQYAASIVTLLEGENDNRVLVDARTVAEAKGYSVWMEASYYFETQHSWQEALVLFVKAK